MEEGKIKSQALNDFCRAQRSEYTRQLEVDHTSMELIRCYKVSISETNLIIIFAVQK